MSADNFQKVLKNRQDLAELLGTLEAKLVTVQQKMDVLESVIVSVRTLEEKLCDVEKKFEDIRNAQGTRLENVEEAFVKLKEEMEERFLDVWNQVEETEANVEAMDERIIELESEEKSESEGTPEDVPERKSKKPKRE